MRGNRGGTRGEGIPFLVTAAILVLFFVIGATQSTYGPLMPYLRSHFGIDVATGGLIVSAHFAGGLTAVAAWGMLGRRWTMRRYTVLAATLLTAGCLGAVAAPSWQLFLMAVAAIGVGWGAVATACNAFGATAYGRRSVVMVSFFNAAYGVGSFAGPAIVGLTPGHSGAIAFGLAAVLSIVAIPPLRGMLAPAIGDTSVTAVTGHRVRVVMFATAAMFFVYSGVEVGTGAWASTHLVALGFSAAFAAAVTSAFWAAYTVSRLIGVPITAGIPAPRMLMGLFGCTIALLLLANVGSVTPAAYALVGLVVGPIFPVAVVWITGLVPRGTNVTAYVIAGASLGGLTLPALLGKVEGAVGPAAIPTGLAAFAALSLGLMLIMHLRLARMPEPSAELVGASQEAQRTLLRKRMAHEDGQ